MKRVYVVKGSSTLNVAIVLPEQKRCINIDAILGEDILKPKSNLSFKKKKRRSIRGRYILGHTYLYQSK